MSDREHARVLIELARRDLIAAKAMDEPDVFSDEIVGFHIQQAIEKSLKAWLAYLGESYPKTHDIRLLLFHLKKLGHPAEMYESLIEYSIFAVQYRYEIDTMLDYPLCRQDACRHTEELVTHVAGLLAM